MTDIFYNEDDINVGVREPETTGVLGSVLSMTNPETPLKVFVDGEERTVTSAGIVQDDDGAHAHFVINL
jgi:hypothetical protein